MLHRVFIWISFLVPICFRYMPIIFLHSLIFSPMLAPLSFCRSPSIGHGCRVLRSCCCITPLVRETSRLYSTDIDFSHEKPAPVQLEHVQQRVQFTVSYKHFAIVRPPWYLFNFHYFANSKFFLQFFLYVPDGPTVGKFLQNVFFSYNTLNVLCRFP